MFPTNAYTAQKSYHFQLVPNPRDITICTTKLFLNYFHLVTFIVFQNCNLQNETFLTLAQKYTYLHNHNVFILIWRPKEHKTIVRYLIS